MFFKKSMSCPFCDFDNEIKYRLLEETDNFYLIPGVGAFIVPYILILSKEHYTCLASLPQEWLTELVALEKKAKKFISDVYNLPIIEYEHGECMYGNDRSGACVKHFHLVLIGTKKDIYGTIEKNLGKPDNSIKKFSELKHLDEEHRGYLLYKKNHKWVYWKGRNLISQFTRRLLAEDQRKNIYNWRIHPYFENMQTMIKDWKKWKKTSDN